MWTCNKCGERIEDQFDACWKCSTPKGEILPTATEAPPIIEGKRAWRMAYKYFRGTFVTWDDLFSEAAQFATEVGPEHVVGISHSCDDSNAVVTVWYWTLDVVENT